MSLVLPGELVVDEVLPTVRAMLARELAARDLTQQEIAAHLGVTQAAVSSYLADEQGPEGPIAGDHRTQATVERIAEGLATGGMDSYDALGELLALIREFEDRGPICDLHEEAMPALQGLGCDLCVRGTDDDLSTERETLATVRRAARTLSTAEGMAEFIPKVGTNVGMALPDPEGTHDVAAIPGRIYAMGDRVRVPANPEFGASEYVASLILAAMTVDSSLRGALNLVTDDALLDAARDRGIDPLEVDAGYDERGARLRGRFQERGAVPRVVYHRGAFGIEPVLYVLGTSAEEAASLAVSLAEAADRE
ncbi:MULTISPECIES: thiamine-phosphate synthase family protein [Salinibaculum]|uniref:thiamine-phosphate synthase family protein n=1 Tax=Salinibaculum TaxID=2732368 RepID=UPI0030CFEA92